MIVCSHKWATISAFTTPSEWKLCMLCGQDSPEGYLGEKRETIWEQLRLWSSLNWQDPEEILKNMQPKNCAAPEEGLK